MASASLKTHILCAVFLAAFASAAPTTNSSTASDPACIDLSSPPSATCYLIAPNAEIIDEADIERVRSGIMECPCSPTKRGTSRNATAYLSEFRKLDAEVMNIVQNELYDTTLGTDLASKLQLILQKCIDFNSVEECVNADIALRGKVEYTMCMYDVQSNANLYDHGTNLSSSFVTLSPCNIDPTYASKKAPSTPELSSPTPRAKMIPQTRLKRNEGCVAVEHLQGYVLQHTSHLLRPVLCSNGFCATPNHAIIVKGEMTSMKQLCGSGRWKCVQQVKLVNNLKISANRRAKINDEITVTPYDVRFPKALIWVVQMAEDIWNVLALSIYTGTLAGIAVLLISTAETKN